MIRWRDITTTLERLVGDLAFGDCQPPFAAQWHDRARAFTHQATQTDITLAVRGIRALGEDETRYENHGDPPTLRAVQAGDRVITIGLKVESLSQSDELWAFATVERIRTRLRRPTSLARLRAANLGIVDIGNTVPLPVPRDGRLASVAALDLVLSTRFEDVDLDTAASWIARVELTSRVRDVDGEPLPSPLNSTFTVGND